MVIVCRIYEYKINKILRNLCSHLNRQYQEMNRKYESATKEAEYYRKQERTAYGSLQSLRIQYDEVV